jgi:hypothetical protein
MRCNLKKGMGFLLALLLVSGLGVGCGGGAEEGTVIKIGQITDFTGISAPSLVPLNNAVEDVARYFNEEGLITDATIDVMSFNEKSDYSRDIPGYNQLRENGAQVIITLLPTTGEMLKDFSEYDKVPLAALGGSTELVDPPAWAFWFNAPPAKETRTLLEWISDNDWDWEADGPAKIGLAAWSAPYQRDMKNTLEDYCQTHPDQYELVGTYLIPLGDTNWAGEVEELKDCDYIMGGAIALAAGSFIKQFDDRGYTATFVGGSAVTAFLGFIVDMCGWEALDGTLTCAVCPWWDESYPLVNLAKQLLNEYRPGDAEEMMSSGTSYLGGLHNMYAICEVVQDAVEAVGPEEFDGQAFYDAAMDYKTDSDMWVGYPAWGFSETKMHLVDDLRIYEWSALEEDMVMASDWIEAEG